MQLRKGKASDQGCTNRIPVLAKTRGVRGVVIATGVLAEGRLEGGARPGLLLPPGLAGSTFP